MKSGHQVLIEKSAGLASGFTDASYKEAGANISSAKEILKKSQILVKIQLTSNEEIKEMQANTILISQVNVNSSADLIKSLNAKKVSLFALERIPRITRAQNMDPWSVQDPKQLLGSRKKLKKFLLARLKLIISKKDSLDLMTWVRKIKNKNLVLKVECLSRQKDVFFPILILIYQTTPQLLDLR